MHRLCEALSICGRDAALIQDQASFHPEWFESSVNTISRKDLLKRSDLSAARDILVLPETFLCVYNNYLPGIPKVIFNQNGAYTFGSGSSSWPSPDHVLQLYQNVDLLQILCVSSHDQRLLSKGFSLGNSMVSLLKNPIETDIFQYDKRKNLQIAFMPRKNSVDASVVSAMLTIQPWWKDWRLVPIHNMSQSKVAHTMQNSIAFLAFGHPEGFGLPLAEALCCGCALIGYSGLGGRELFKLGAKHGVALEISYGDWFGFVQALSALDRSLKNSSGDLYKSLLSCSDETRALYSSDAFIASVSDALFKIESNRNTYLASLGKSF